MTRLWFREGVIAAEEPGATPFARLLPGSLLAMARDGVGVGAPEGCGRWVAWCGSYAELDEGGLFDAHPRTWSAPGWKAFEDACAAAAPPEGTTILLRTHARHALSDVPSLRRFAAEVAPRWPGRFGLLLDPSSMVELSHLERDTGEDLIARILEGALTLGMPIAAAVFATVRRREAAIERVWLTDDATAGGGLRDRFAALGVPLVIGDGDGPGAGRYTGPS